MHGHRNIKIKKTEQELSSLLARNRSIRHLCNWNERQSSKVKRKAYPMTGWFEDS